MHSISVSGGSDQTTGANAILNLIDETLGNNERFVLAQIGHLDLHKTFIVHLKDNAQRILLTFTLIPRPRDNRFQENIIQITTTSGRMLLTARVCRLNWVCRSGVTKMFISCLIFF